MNLNAAHVHLLVNHFPILGAMFGFGLWVIALWWRNLAVRQIALGVFVLTALAAIVAYFSGEAAHEVVHGIPGVPAEPIELHEEAAGYTTIVAVILGILGALGLADSLTVKRVRPAIWWANGVVGLIVVLMMIWTGNRGGQIRHEEIRPGWVPSEEVAHTHDGEEPHSHDEEEPHAELGSESEAEHVEGETSESSPTPLDRGGGFDPRGRKRTIPIRPALRRTSTNRAWAILWTREKEVDPPFLSSVRPFGSRKMSKRLSRRDFFGLLGLGAVGSGAGTGPRTDQAAWPSGVGGRSRPKNAPRFVLRLGAVEFGRLSWSPSRYKWTWAEDSIRRGGITAPFRVRRFEFRKGTCYECG
ncbi:MAG: hypothetical protein KatS3mg115_0499 [Candidatus Poribacteria bacterium]|nr:MAG: hypothetical protein KatS3mg115_0499 [Candidatus Poribacteria bacterium]